MCGSRHARSKGAMRHPGDWLCAEPPRHSWIARTPSIRTRTSRSSAPAYAALPDWLSHLTGGMGHPRTSTLCTVTDSEGRGWQTRPKWIEAMAGAAGNLRERLEKGRDPAVVLRLAESNLERQLRRFGPDGSPTARAREQLAQRLEAMGRFEEARPLRELVADGYRRHFGDEHPFTLTEEEWLAINLSKSGMLM
jgi:hypothetical protein